jgi:hypothetical protein
MTDTYANGPTPPGDAASRQAGGDVTGTLAELERKLRELERELTSIGRRRELAVEGAAPHTPQGAQPAHTSGRLVDEAIESSVPPAPTVPFSSPAPTVPPPATPPPASPNAPLAPTPNAPPSPATPPAAAPAAAAPGAGRPVKFVRPLESARAQVGRETRPSQPTEAEPASAGPRAAFDPQPGERPRPSEAQLASLAELRRFRDRLERLARDLAAEYDALLSRVMAGLTSASPAPAAPAAGEPSGSLSAAAVASPPAPPSGEETLFEGRVELGVGPFYDLASLSAFERRLASLPHVSEASVRRFEASHAVVDLRLAAPVALVQELRRTAESDFSVREVADGRILLTFDEG